MCVRYHYIYPPSVRAHAITRLARLWSTHHGTHTNAIKARASKHTPHTTISRTVKKRDTHTHTSRLVSEAAHLPDPPSGSYGVCVVHPSLPCTHTSRSHLTRTANARDRAALTDGPTSMETHTSTTPPARVRRREPGSSLRPSLVSGLVSSERPVRPFHHTHFVRGGA